jgi:hypothetical protein
VKESRESAAASVSDHPTHVRWLRFSAPRASASASPSPSARQVRRAHTTAHTTSRAVWKIDAWIPVLFLLAHLASRRRSKQLPISIHLCVTGVRSKSRAAVRPRVVSVCSLSAGAAPRRCAAQQRRAASLVPTAIAVPTAGAGDVPSQKYFSGLNGMALDADQKSFPSMAEVLSKIPKHCFVKDTAKSLMYAATSTALTVGCGVLAYL